MGKKITRRTSGGAGKKGAQRALRDLPNIGPAMERDLHLLGIRRVGQLVKQDPLKMYERLCRATNSRQDPCVLDVFMAAVASARGKDRPWWEYTGERRKLMAKREK